jgi:PKD repeat protein
MFTSSGLSTANYNKILNCWGAQGVTASVTMSIGPKYDSGSPATSRQHLIDAHGWTITDGGASGSAYAEPVAAFSGTPLTGPPGTATQFTDTSTGSPDEWDWDFGDGTAHGTTQNPLHTYSAPGNYTVILTITADCVTDAETKTGYVEIIMENPVITDLFDDAAIDPKWTTGVLVGDGSVTEAGGYLHLNFAEHVLSFPYAVQDNAYTPTTLDVRVDVHLSATLYAFESFLFLVAEDYTTLLGAGDFVSIYYKKSGENWVVERYDREGGIASEGVAVTITATDFFLRIVGNGDGTFSCYYTTTCDGNWTMLAEPAGPFVTAMLPLDPMLLGYSVYADSGVVSWNWITTETENPGWPLAGECTTTTTTTSTTTTTTSTTTTSSTTVDSIIDIF